MRGFQQNRRVSEKYARGSRNGLAGNYCSFPPVRFFPQKPWEEISDSLLSDEKAKQNAESLSSNCRKETVDVPSISRIHQISETTIDTVAAVYYMEGGSDELLQDRHKQKETVDLEALQTNQSELLNAGRSNERYQQEILRMIQDFKPT